MSRDLFLFVNFAYYGFGKTRFGVEFLTLFRKYLGNNPEELTSLTHEYGQDALNKVINAKLVYMDMRELEFSSKTFSILRNLIPKDNNYYFVVLDEYPSFCSKYSNQDLLKTMYDVWASHIFELQKLPNVIGVYVCGKGAFLDVFGKSILRTVQSKHTSPTLCHRVELHALTIYDLEAILKTKPKLENHLKNNGIYEFTLNEILEETGGIPLLVDRLFTELQKYPSSKEEVLKILKTLPHLVPNSILYPFAETNNEDSFSFKIFSFLLFISQGKVIFPVNKTFDTSMYELDKIEELKDFTRVDFVTLATVLNCYVTTTENSDEVKLVFPRETLRHYEPSLQKFSILPFVKLLSSVMDKGGIFECLIGTYIFWSSICGKSRQLTWGKAIPFLKETPVKDILCTELSVSPTDIKLGVDTAKEFWAGVYNENWTKYENKLNFMFSKSAGPEKFVVFKRDIWWCIQDKNKNDFSFTELYDEVELMKKCKPSDVNVILTVIYKSSIDKMYVKCFNPGSIITRKATNMGPKPTTNEIVLPLNFTLVVVDEEMVEQFIGKNNLTALNYLSKEPPGILNIPAISSSFQ